MKSKFLHLLNDELVKLVNLVMQSLKATKRQSDTTIFAESVKVSKFHETFAKSLKSLMSIFSSRGVMDVRVSLGQYRTDYQRISNLYLTPNRFFTRFAAVFALVFVLGVGNVWGAPTTYNFSSIPTTGWSTSGGSQTINGKSWTYSSSTYIGIGNSSSRIQIGSKNSPQTSNWTIQTAISNFGANKKITAVAITAYTTATTATYEISVGGSSVKSGSLTTSSNTYSASSLNATSGNIVITLKGSSSSKAMYLSNIAVTYDDNSGPTLYTVTYDANGGSVTPASATQASAGAAITTPTPTRTGYTCSGWYSATSGGTKRCNAGESYTPTATETIHAQWTPNNYSVNWVVNGNTWTGASHGTPSTNANYNTKPATIPTAPTSSACDGSKVFVGWTNNEYEHATNAPAILFTTQANSPAITDNTTFYAVFATASAGEPQEVNDVLNRATTGVTGTSYSSWSNKKASSDAVYAGNSAGGNSSIQLRSSDNSGLITTTTGGKAKKVTVAWNSNTANGRTLDIYGKNSAYSVASDLYGDNKGTKLGSIVYGTSTEFTITGDYEYIGMRSNSGAMYLTSVTIEWEAGSAPTYSNYATTCCTSLAQINGSINLSHF